MVPDAMYAKKQHEHTKYLSHILRKFADVNSCSWNTQHTYTTSILTFWHTSLQHYTVNSYTKMCLYYLVIMVILS